MKMPPDSAIQADVTRALEEDLGAGDLTASLLPAGEPAIAEIICRQSAILSGQAWLDETLRQVDVSLCVEWIKQDGDRVQSGERICVISGCAASILTAERTALNFLQTFSGTATRTASYVTAVAGTGVRILDTRKTLPGLRLGQKYAVLCGGGSNHRMGLYDVILIKENHIAAAGSIAAVLQQARSLHPSVPLEIEVEDLSELEEALKNGAQRVLLDNFTRELLVEAVAQNQGRARLEASGGITLETIRDVALTGVDDISVGALTKDLESVDFSLLFTTP